jgi:hypothetical protein
LNGLTNGPTRGTTRTADALAKAREQGYRGA